MLSLTRIRDSFAPYVPIRWKVQFSDPSLNVVSDMFPAKEVTYNDVEYINQSVEIGIGINVNFNVLTKPVTSLDVKFYENEEKDIVNYIKTLNRDLDEGKGGFMNDLDFTVIEYDRSLRETSRDIFMVQITDSVVKMLQQEASPWSGILKLNVIGRK